MTGLLETENHPTIAETYGLGGFAEAGICTADIDRWADLLTQAGGYREVWRGESGDDLKNFYGLPATARARECLLANSRSAAPARIADDEPTDTGFIRLFEFSGIEQQLIRPASRTWDPGGIFDLDIRVPAVLPFVDVLESRGWQGISQPVDWQFGDLQIREWLVRGPDDVILALIERRAPPLQGFDDLAGFSHVFNSSQIVTSMDRSVSFYQALGFRLLVDHDGPLAGRGGEVLGLPASEAPDVPIRLVIMHPLGTMNGSIELVSFENAGQYATGDQLADRAAPTNHGLNLLRFPVTDIEAYHEHIRQQPGAEPTAIAITAIEPIGDVRMFAVTTPDGAWLEFYQPFF